jgi:transcriptional regulator with XRE-family HTH domain
MPDPSFGTWLRRERERRGATLKTISDQTKVSVPLLQGLETDDLSRWPTGIFRRAFVRSYATAIGLDPDDVIRRFEREHGASQEVEDPAAGVDAAVVDAAAFAGDRASLGRQPQRTVPTSSRSRVLGTAADLTVALMLGLGSAAADARLLWPVLLIAAYYGVGVLLTGTSPMVALLSDQSFGGAEQSSGPGLTGPAHSTPRPVDSAASEAARPVRQRVQ